MEEEATQQTPDASENSLAWIDENETDPHVLAADLTALATVHAANTETLCAEVDSTLQKLLSECRKLDLECEKIFAQSLVEEESPEGPRSPKAEETQPKSKAQAAIPKRTTFAAAEPKRFVPKVVRAPPKPARPFLPKKQLQPKG
ncbi:hypothetical protein, conserved [Eimeria tenella]|uniref:Uncharacterized protein n=1 Tax=Eimeria tenella TaxID=5802 RepID=U6KRT2_EIMTE|nr:hypothetical protein, conserved [Eimeria tenella]CDJ39628.1 hypothetical protein, conserved [Eimeria tenella]|eukprot:XP_013230383.1 hypothetical protein, conserved [Eimeria tenella]